RGGRRGGTGPRRSATCRRWSRCPGASPRALPSEFDAFLCLHPGGEVVLDEPRLRDEIGGGDHLRLGVAPGHDHVQVRPPGRERRHNGVERQVIIAQGDVEFVENDEADVVPRHQLLRLVPRARCCGDVAGLVLRLPGEALAHAVPFDEIGEALHGAPLARLPVALDELDDPDLPAVAEGTEHEAEGGGGLALAGAGVDDEEALLARLCRHLRILHGLALHHLLAVAGGFLGGDGGHRSRPFTVSGRPATTRVTWSTTAARRWLRRPAWSRKRRASALSGTMPKPTSLATRTSGWRRRATVSVSSRQAASTSSSASMTLVSQRVRQSTRTGAPCGTAAMVAARARGASTVRHPGPRSCRWRAMRSAISASCASAVAI